MHVQFWTAYKLQGDLSRSRSLFKVKGQIKVKISTCRTCSTSRDTDLVLDMHDKYGKAYNLKGHFYCVKVKGHLKVKFSIFRHRLETWHACSVFYSL